MKKYINGGYISGKMNNRLLKQNLTKIKKVCYNNNTNR